LSSVTKNAKGLATAAQSADETRRKFLLGLLVVPLIGCGKGKIGENSKSREIRNVSSNPGSRQMGIEELRAALIGGHGIREQEQNPVLDNSNIPMRLMFLGRPRNVIWTEHTEDDVLAFETRGGVGLDRTNWPDGVTVRSYSVSLVLPRGEYAIDGEFRALVRDEPVWCTEWDLRTYASTMLTFYGFYLIDKGKQSGANVLNYASVVSYDSSLPEGRLNGMKIFIDREKVEVYHKVGLTRDMRSALDEVRAEYPFSMLENYYKIGVGAFNFNKRMDAVGKTQRFE